jgi:hypothetical protein
VRRPLLLALVLAGPALAQEQEPSSLRFARALSDRGWTDVAGAVLDGLAADRSTPAELRAELDLLRADLLTREAGTAPTARERRVRADAARAIFERAGSDDARLRSGEVLLQVGEAALRRLLDPATDAAEREPARAEAREAFAAARAHFAALEAAWAEAVANAAQPEPDPVFRLSLAALDEGRARFGAARACDPGAERDRLLADAVARFGAVAADYADVYDTTFEAGLQAGYAERERGRLVEAAAAFGGAAELAGRLLQEEWRAQRTTDDSTGWALAQALWLRTQALCELGAFEDALACAKVFAGRFPGAATRGDALAQLVLVEQARATAGAGDAKGALALLEPLLARPANGAVARAARAAKREAAGLGSGDGLAAEDALRAAEALLERGQAVAGARPPAPADRRARAGRRAGRARARPRLVALGAGVPRGGAARRGGGLLPAARPPLAEGPPRAAGAARGLGLRRPALAALLRERPRRAPAATTRWRPSRPATPTLPSATPARWSQGDLAHGRGRASSAPRRATPQGPRGRRRAPRPRAPARGPGLAARGRGARGEEGRGRGEGRAGPGPRRAAARAGLG